MAPCFVDTVVPSIRGSKSLWTPSLETSAPVLSLLEVILSISSIKTIPFCSTSSSALAASNFLELIHRYLSFQPTNSFH